MEADRFDTAIRSLTVASSRRRALALVLGGTLAPLFAREHTDAHNRLKRCRKKSGKRKKRCVRKAKRHNATHSGSPLLPCTPNCGGKDCGDDGCGGSCGACQGGTCQGGACTCPTGMMDCGGVCVNPGIDPRHCGGCGRRCPVNEACVGGQCRCGSGGGCGDTGTCCPGGGCKCSSGDPIDPATCQPVSTCPTGSNPCAGPDGFCGPGFTTRTCCPSGTTCTAEGTCLQ